MEPYRICKQKPASPHLSLLPNNPHFPLQNPIMLHNNPSCQQQTEILSQSKQRAPLVTKKKLGISLSLAAKAPQLEREKETKEEGAPVLPTIYAPPPPNRKGEKHLVGLG